MNPEPSQEPAPPGRFAQQRPQRVRVQAPQDASLSFATSQEEHTAQEFYIQQLIRSQLRLACSVAAGLLTMLVGISALLALWPTVYEFALWHIPLPWWILGIGIYPLIIVAGLLFNGAAARNEKRYRSISRD
ncbi:hypothetical protein [Glutamicibacter sp. NPDC087344]|uniref:hypothetical protein n=1 Tax=Glutamicibacter sp. NPDC087344 TaxID=3363994 RepID=UPI00381834D4